MADPREPWSEDAQPPVAQRSGGIDVSGGEVRVGRDVAGRDIVHIGYSPAFVQRLILLMGLLSFATALCVAFSGALFFGGAALIALSRPVQSSQTAAAEMQRKLLVLEQLPPGQPFALTFTEDEISSYMRFVVGPQIGLTDARVRLLEPGRFVVGGQWAGLGDLPIAVTLRLSGGDTPLQAEGAAVRLLSVGDSTFGWVAVPLSLTQPFVDQFNEWFFREASLQSVTPVSGVGQAAWRVTGVAQ